MSEDLKTKNSINMCNFNIHNHIHCESVMDGKSVVVADIYEESKNVWEIPHGAIIFAIADVASGVAVHNASGKSTKTISSSLNFLDNFTDIKKLTAYGEVTRLGKSVGYTNVIVKDDQDRLIAQGQYVMKVISKDVYKK